MWDPQWNALADTWDVTRLDLRGFGESHTPPTGPLSRVEDVVATMDDAGLDRVHLVGASLGSGVAVEAALTAPHRVASLLLCPPGGGLLAARTDDLSAFAEQEDAALDAGDLDAAVEANVRAWVVGHGRTEADVDPGVVAAVRQMQRRAFEIDEVLGDLERVEMTPPFAGATRPDRRAALILLGGHDLQATRVAADLDHDSQRSAVLGWPDR